MLPPSKSDALQLLQKAAAAGDPDAMLEAGAEALQSGAQQEALAPVQEMARRQPGNPRLWQLLGLLNRDMQNLAASIDAFDKAAKLLPNDAMIANGRACATFEAGLPAAELFERAIELDPADRSLWLRLAAAWVQEGQLDAVLAGLEEELARDPGWIEGHKSLAKLRWEAGDREGFARSFDAAVQAVPRNKALWLSYIRAVAHDNLHERALEVIERAKAALGPLAEFEAAVAVARTELGQLEAAAPLFARVAHLGDLSTLVAYLRFLIRSGRFEEAAAVAQSNVEQAGQWMWPYLSICWRLLGDQRWQWLEGDPELIGVYDIAGSLPDLDRLAERLRALHWANVEPVDQSLRGGTQTQGDLLIRLEPEIRQLRQAIVEAVEHHAAQLPPPRPQHPTLIEQRSPILFSGSWSVRLTGGGRHIDHLHPAGWLSSALYVALPSEGERGTGEAGWLALGQARDLVPDLPPIRVIEPKPGRLVLFPSTMWHGTRPFGAGERLTVAFDVKRPA
ncbi:MAG: putative 2OG-Fe(II) oxygenase [Sphingomicrobium sp.]